MIIGHAVFAREFRVAFGRAVILPLPPNHRGRRQGPHVQTPPAAHPILWESPPTTKADRPSIATKVMKSFVFDESEAHMPGLRPRFRFKLWGGPGGIPRPREI
jgi:hypothetical protein